jgi:hypothetical protein
MAAVRTNALHLWPRGELHGGNQTFGSLLVGGIDGPWNTADGGLRVAVEYRPPAVETEPRKLVEFSAAVVSAWPGRHIYGRMRPVAEGPGWGAFLGAQTATFWWLWNLTLDEIETIERERAPNASAEVVLFSLEVNGIVVVGAQTWGFRGESQFSLATADWLGLARAMGYATPPSLRDLAGTALTLSPSWTWAEQKLAAARRHLALGEDREALTSAYTVLDGVSANPYKARWDEVLADPELPTEKADALRRVLQAHAQLLSKLGRHPSFELSDGRDRGFLPLDHWEAELLIGLTQLVLTGIERWRTLHEIHGLEVGTAHPEAGAAPAERS